MFSFTITSADSSSSARAGVFTTPHGSFETPCFMPCGTKGTVKSLTPDELKTLGCQIMLGNTFHLMLRPGADVVQRMGGLHRWISWDRPILTDSGGFQVFSLLHKPRMRDAPSHGRIQHIDDDGVTFQSPVDGSPVHLSPERSIQIQEQLGADIIMAFDECPPGNCGYETAKKAMQRTHAWLLRSLKAKTRPNQALFPIVQGGVFDDLRRESAQFISAVDAPGYAIGGVAVGESKEHVRGAVELAAPLLPANKPRYLMGVGDPGDIIHAVGCGIDMFDCVLPTRLARHGSFFQADGSAEAISNKRYLDDGQPLAPGCACLACAGFSRSYLRHLIMEHEILGHRLLTIHNLHFLLDLMRRIRTAIQCHTFSQTSFLNSGC